MTAQIITLAPPDGSLYAAVEVWAASVSGEFRKVGAYPAFTIVETVVGQTWSEEFGELVDETKREMKPAPKVGAPCYLQPDDTRLLCHWVYEDSALGLNTVERTVNERRYR